MSALVRADIDREGRHNCSRMTWRLFLPSLLLIVASCSEQPRFRASPSRVEAQGVSLAIVPCEPTRPACDFEFELANHSDHCVAFLGISLPPDSFIFFESTFPSRIQGYPSERARHSWVVLQPGDRFGEGVDVQSLSGLRDLTALSFTVSTRFTPCASFVQPTGIVPSQPGVDQELESETITFSRVL